MLTNEQNQKLKDFMDTYHYISKNKSLWIQAYIIYLKQNEKQYKYFEYNIMEQGKKRELDPEVKQYFEKADSVLNSVDISSAKPKNHISKEQNETLYHTIYSPAPYFSTALRDSALLAYVSQEEKTYEIFMEQMKREKEELNEDIII